MTNMTDLPPDIIYKIHDFKVGDNTYWNTKFNDVVNQLNNTYFFCETHWCSHLCNMCDKCHTDLTTELNCDEALKEYENNYIGMVCQSCGSVIHKCKISFVNEQNYYHYLEYLYGLDSDMD